MAKETENQQAMAKETIAKNPTVVDAVQTIQFTELLPHKIMQMPCATSSLLLGFTTGASLGFSRFYATRKVRSAINWAFFPFIVVSSLSW